MRNPPTAVATTGVPQACDSMATNPNDSLYDGTTVRSAARYQSASEGCGTGSVNRTRSDRPELRGQAAAASRDG